jgi:superfamily II DNA or RNA helicase
MTQARTYLGPKGYSIMKDSICMSEQDFIRKELMVTPFVPKGMFKAPPAFPVYRESHQKLYVPRFFGENLYGVPDDTTISPGLSIKVDFKGELRKQQLPIIDAFMKCANTKGCGLVELPCGFGKTIIALNILSRLEKKTLVIVHKEFLLEQWLERIREFLPTARVGRIQGQIIDIEDKDIVIGMLQSLAMKEYPIETFQDFGFTIVDETHHIAAEVFSNSLFKIVTPYMLGLSATMTRKDGLTKIFKMFLGEVEYKAKREKKSNLVVKVIHYRVNDDEYNETLVDYRGYPQYSRMICKLCAYAPRADFVVRILSDLIKPASNMQIMVLSQNKSLLHHLYKSLEDAHPSIAGFYVGGMKQKDLKLTESKKIILATYAMAEEALDIKTLTTLVMATPKTNVTQSIGRILRTDHENPLVIDLVDCHDVFVKQWGKRKAHYFKNEYKIIQTDTEGYETDSWIPLEKPTRAKSKPKCLVPLTNLA